MNPPARPAARRTAPLDRRGFLATSAAILASNAAAEDDVLKSQPLPEPRIALPTDALPPPTGPKKRVAAITTSYFKYSHADDFITKFIEGYGVVGRVHEPHCVVSGMHVEQFPKTDIGRGMAARYNIPLYDSVEKTLTGGGKDLAVDGVLLIGELGEYPHNGKGQQLYPRRRLFEEITKVFRRSGRSVPVFCDKHLSYSWEFAREMYRASKELGFAFMAGSSVPVTWRKPALAFRPGIRLESALGVGFAGLESYGFHTLELMQSFVEKRKGGETGVKSVRCLQGDAAWKAAEHGEWNAKLLSEAAGRVPGLGSGLSLSDLRRKDPNAAVFLIDYSDGFRAASYVAKTLLAEFAFAAAVGGGSNVSTWCPLIKPQRDHFSFLCNHIEVMFRSGKPSYPVERTLLVTGVLAALMDSVAEGGSTIKTPHLAELAYVPAPDFSTS